MLCQNALWDCFGDVIPFFYCLLRSCAENWVKIQPQSYAAHFLTSLKLPHIQKFFGIFGVNRWPEGPLMEIFGVQWEGSLESFKKRQGTSEGSA